MNKQKFSYVMISIVSLFLGIIGTIGFYNYSKPKDKTNEMVVKNVTVNETNTIYDSIEKIYDATVVVEAYRGGRQISSGTGFFYRKDDNNGYIITNNHVIEDADEVRIVNVHNASYEAKVLGSDEYADIAVLSTEAEAALLLAQIGNSSDLLLGDTLFTVGTPVDKEYMGTVTKGILSGKDRIVTVTGSDNNSIMMSVLQTDAAINPGNSGGPLVNINGEVVGVNSLKLVEDKIEGMGFAIPIETVMAFTDRLEKGEKIVRPILGVELVDPDNSYYLYRNRIYLDHDFENGTVVAGVSNNSTASEYGLKKGDVILAVDDVKIKNTAHFRFVLYKYSVGNKITISYYSSEDKKEKEVVVELKNGTS